MGNLLSAKPPVTSEHDHAILELKVQRDRIKQYQKRLQQLLDQHTLIARHHLKKGDKKRALLSLRQQKYQQHLLEQTDLQLLNVEQLCQQVEYALVQKEVVAGLQKGKGVLQQLNKEMDVDKVRQLMEDTADAVAYQKEVEDLLAGKLTEEDESDVLNELEALEREAIEKQIEQLPSVPTTATTLPAPQEQIEQEQKVEKKKKREERKQQLEAA